MKKYFSYFLLLLSLVSTCSAAEIETKVDLKLSPNKSANNQKKKKKQKNKNKKLTKKEKRAAKKQASSGSKYTIHIIAQIPNNCMERCTLAQAPSTYTIPNLLYLFQKERGLKANALLPYTTGSKDTTLLYPDTTNDSLGTLFPQQNILTLIALEVSESASQLKKLKSAITEKGQYNFKKDLPKDSLENVILQGTEILAKKEQEAIETFCTKHKIPGKIVTMPTFAISLEGKDLNVSQGTTLGTVLNGLKISQKSPRLKLIEGKRSFYEEKYFKKTPRIYERNDLNQPLCKLFALQQKTAIKLSII